MVISLLRAVPFLAAVFIDPQAMTTARPRSRQAAVTRPILQSRDSLLLTPSQLRERMTRGGVVLLHIGERADSPPTPAMRNGFAHPRAGVRSTACSR